MAQKNTFPKIISLDKGRLRTNVCNRHMSTIWGKFIKNKIRERNHDKNIYHTADAMENTNLKWKIFK